MLARHGIVVDRSTLASWVDTAAAELKPLWRLLRDQLLGSAKLFVDETWRRCSIPAAAGPRPAGSGRSHATTGRGPAPIRRRWSLPTRPAASTSMRRNC
jgi:hypothetical protein